MMKKPFFTLFCVVLISCLGSNKVKSQDYNSAIGARLGSYFAASYKTFIDESAALEGIAGISRTGGVSQIALGAFYQRHNLITEDISTLKWYYGGGAFVALGEGDINTNIAIAGNLGLEYTLENSPVNFFIDAIPNISLTGGSSFDIEASIGARYIIASSK